MNFFDDDVAAAVELRGHELVGAAADHNAHLMPFVQEIFEDDPAAGRMTHAFADDAVQNLHAHPPTSPANQPLHS